MSTIDSWWNWWQTKRQISRKYRICLHRNMALPLYTYALNLHLRLLHQNIQKCNCALDTQKSERALNFNYMTTQKSIWIYYFHYVIGIWVIMCVHGPKISLQNTHRQSGQSFVAWQSSPTIPMSQMVRCHTLALTHQQRAPNDQLRVASCQCQNGSWLLAARWFRPNSPLLGGKWHSMSVHHVHTYIS